MSRFPENIPPSKRHDFEDFNTLSPDFRPLVHKSKLIILVQKYDSIRADSMIHNLLVATNLTGWKACGAEQIVSEGPYEAGVPSGVERVGL